MAEADSPASIAPSRALPLIMVVSGLFGAQRGMLGPLIPLYIISLGHGFAWLGVIVAAQGAFQVLLRFFGGIFADRFGEQTVLRVGFFIMVLGSMIFIFLSAIWALIVAQLFIGASRAVHNSAAQSYASRITEGNRAKVMGRFRGSESLGSAIGPPSTVPLGAGDCHRNTVVVPLEAPAPGGHFRLLGGHGAKHLCGSRGPFLPGVGHVGRHKQRRDDRLINRGCCRWVCLWVGGLAHEPAAHRRRGHVHVRLGPICHGGDGHDAACGVGPAAVGRDQFAGQ